MKRRLICPETSSHVDIEFDESPIDGTVVGVRSCSRFHPASLVTCDAACIHALNQQLDELVEREGEAPARSDRERRNELL